MKIEIDLNNLLFDEHYGPETLQESVQRQVVDSVKKQVLSASVHKVQEEIDRQIADTVSQAIKDRLPELFDDLLNAEYIPVGRFGAKQEPTSFRKELVKTIQEQMVYKKENYDSNKNAFTKAVDSIVSEQMTAIKKDFEKTVSEETAKQAFSEAVSLLKKKLGITV